MLHEDTGYGESTGDSPTNDYGNGFADGAGDKDHTNNYDIVFEGITTYGEGSFLDMDEKCYGHGSGSAGYGSVDCDGYDDGHPWLGEE